MFVGLFALGTDRDARDLISADALAECFPDGMPSDKQGNWLSADAVMAGALLWNTAPSRAETVPEVCRRSGRVILSWARLDNRADVCAALGLTCSDALSDPQIILAAFDRFGEDCVERLDGDFSFVIFDPSDRSLFCGRDIMGARPLFYAVTDEFALVASSAAAIRATGLVALTPNTRWIVQTLAMSALEPESTAYNEIKRLPSAHSLTLSSQLPPVVRRCFAFRTDAPSASSRDPQWVERHRDLFHAAIERRAQSDFLVGAEYSAGLDSTSILSHLVHVLPHSRDQFHCFSDLASSGEAQLLLPPALRYDVRHTHVFARHNRLQLGADFEQSLDAVGYPIEHMQTLMHKPFLKMAQDLGIRTLISGFGGDEFATSGAGYVSWELLDRKEYRALLDMRKGSLPSRAVQLARMRFGRGRADAGDDMAQTLFGNLVNAPLRDGVAEDFGMAEHIKSLVDPMRGHRSQSEISAQSPYGTIAPMVRLESYTLFARQFGIEYRWPMLDRQLVQNYLLTPAIEKRYRQWGRYLHRRAMDGVVPDAINWNPDKYLGDPVGVRESTPIPEKQEVMALSEPLASLVDQRRLEELYDNVLADLNSETYDV